MLEELPFEQGIKRQIFGNIWRALLAAAPWLGNVDGRFFNYT